MHLILTSEEITLDETRTKIKEAQSDIQQPVTLDEFQDLDKRLKQKLQDLEKAIVKTKRLKFDRDTMDYEQNKVYVWKKFRKPRPILKNNLPVAGRKVSFGSTDAESQYNHDGTSTSANNSSYEDQSSAPSSPERNQKPPSKNANARGGQGGNTAKRYPQRHRRNK